jgi:hypothetical protein
MEPGRKAEAVAPAPVDDLRHPCLLLLAPHTEWHEEDPVGGKGVLSLDLQDLVEIALLGDDELEPGAEFAKSIDRRRTQAPGFRYARVGKLQRGLAPFS